MLGPLASPGPYLMPQFSARSSRIELVTHKFRWDSRPQSFSYLKRHITIWHNCHHPHMP